MFSRYLFFLQNIIADMRKVLSKNPQIGSQKLHRMVILENINPDLRVCVRFINLFTCKILCFFAMSQETYFFISFFLTIFSQRTFSYYWSLADTNILLCENSL